MNAEDVLHFWFEETPEESYWSKDSAFDGIVEKRFGSLLKAAERGELSEWRRTTRGRLAEIIILDQFSRNIYRGSEKAFQNDGMALVLAQEMVLLKLDQELPPSERRFAYMPFMHVSSD